MSCLYRRLGEEEENYSASNPYEFKAVGPSRLMKNAQDDLCNAWVKKGLCAFDEYVQHAQCCQDRLNAGEKLPEVV